MPQQHDFARMADQAKAEIQNDVPGMKTGLDLTSGVSKVPDQQMAEIVRNNWNDPGFRHDLVDKNDSAQVVKLVLMGFNVKNPDGSPMTVNDYQKNVLQPFLDGGGHPADAQTPLPPLNPTVPGGPPHLDPAAPLPPPPVPTVPAPLPVGPPHLDPNAPISPPAPGLPSGPTPPPTLGGPPE